MCGITGYWNLTSGEPIDRERLTRMNDVMIPRGPDDDGVFVDGSFGMAARRLSIIDLAGGHQPIGTPDDRWWISYNGEVYNFPEIRERLRSAGASFRTRTDTETVLHLVARDGADAVRELNGMFAFAVFDSKTRSLILARDRLGIKPLFYAYRNGRFVFGSDMKSFIVGHPDLCGRIDLDAVHHYLSLNYIPAPHTIFEGVRCLPPGHTLTLDRAGTLRTNAYWDVRYDPNESRPEGALAEQLRALLEDSVQKRLLSDVPVGVLLSGGIDSSTIAAMMSAKRSTPIKTFSVGFSESSYSEIGFARDVAKTLRTDHYEVEVGAPDGDAIRQLVWDLGQPYADSSMVPLREVCKLAREHVKVVLSGDGGDEVFAGYQTYTAYNVAAHYRRLPAFLREQIIRPVVEKLPTSDRKVSFEYKAKRFVRAASLDPERAHYEFKVLFDEMDKSRLYAKGIAGERPDSFDTFDAYYRSLNGTDMLNRLLYVDTKVYLPDDILVKVDRMSMATSLEARVPFLDHRVVEFAATLPPRLKQHGREGKYLLKRAVRDLLPPIVRSRKKAGFNVPASMWLKGPLRDFVGDYLSPSHIREAGLFDANEVERVRTAHERGEQDRSRELFGLLVFHVWYRHIVKELAAGSPVAAGSQGLE